MSLTSDENFKREIASLALAACDSIDEQMDAETREFLAHKLEVIRSQMNRLEQLAAGSEEFAAKVADFKRYFEHWDHAVRKRYSITQAAPGAGLPKTGDCA